MVVSTVEYLIPTYILGEAVGMPHWDGGRRDANTRTPVNASVQHPAVTSFICLIAIQKHNHMMLLDADSLTSDPSLIMNFIQLLLMMVNERVVI